MKNALLIAGGGTLGCYTYMELLRNGWKLDVIDAEQRISFNRNLRWIRGMVSDELLKDVFAQKRYDAIVDFIHYTDPAEYRRRGAMLLDNTEQLIFLSSYRVYSDVDKVVTEETPQWLDVCKDEYFLTHESYAVPKSHNESWLRSTGKKNWTIIRPMISFSHYRLDLVTQGAQTFFLRAREGKKTLLPAASRYLTAGVNWAGNAGKMIARLCGNPRALGEAFTIGMGETHTWNDVAEIYSDVLGAEFEWVDTDAYIQYATSGGYMAKCMLYFDRLIDRQVDVSKVLNVTGLTGNDLTTTKEGILYELEYLAGRPDLVQRFKNTANRELLQKMDEYLAGKGERR